MQQETTFYLRATCTAASAKANCIMPTIECNCYCHRLL